MKLSEVKVFQPDAFEDYRGELFTLHESTISDIKFNHDKVSISRKHVLRGLHGDNRSWKLATCLHGEIYLVVVDNRPESPTYLQWDSFMITQKNKLQVLIPPRFANGHLVLSDGGVFFYKWAYEGKYPDTDEQFTLKWNDPKLAINWPLNNPILSLRDR